MTELQREVLLPDETLLAYALGEEQSFLYVVRREQYKVLALPPELEIRSLVEDGVRPQRDDRRELWRSFLDIVFAVEPVAVLLENVPDMALGSDMRILRTILEQLEGAGYDADARLLDAWRHGVPQHRQRLIVLARRDGRPLTWPTPKKGRITLRDAIGDLDAADAAAGAGGVARR